MSFSITTDSFNCDVRDEHWVNNAFRFILLNYNQHPSGWGEGHEIRVFHRHFAAIRQMNHEWLERFCVAEVFELFDRHKLKFSQMSGVRK